MGKSWVDPLPPPPPPTPPPQAPRDGVLKNSSTKQGRTDIIIICIYISLLLLLLLLLFISFFPDVNDINIYIIINVYKLYT